MSVVDPEAVSRDEVQRRKLEAIDAAYTEYYDSITDEQMVEEQDWAEMVGPNVLAEVLWDSKSDLDSPIIAS
jgi:hypothetical protein